MVDELGSDSICLFNDDTVSQVSESQTLLSSRSYAYQESAIPLVSLNNSTQSKPYSAFSVNQEALQFLSSLEGPLGVISVAGLYRTGKSFLLNRVLLNQSDGFGVGPSINPCTKGLWVWTRPIPGKTSEGRKCNIVVIDTEGLGALDQDSNHDTRVFSLAVLLSSFFIYNSVGSIDEEALQSLSLVVNLTKHIQVRSKQEDSFEEFSEYFPAFLWVVRDFTLQLVDEEENSISSKEYLDKALMPQKGFSDSTEEKNKIRNLLKTFFKDRDCFTMVRPSTNEDDLQDLSSKNLDDLRPEFVTQVLELRQKVLEGVRPKKLNGKELNGEMLSNLLVSYVSAINNGAVPSIENAWTYISRNECFRAVQKCEELYESEVFDKINERFPLDPEELKLLHRQAKEAALEEFHSKAMGPDKQEAVRKLLDFINDKYTSLKSDNEIESQRLNLQFLKENYEVISRKLKSGDLGTFSDYEKELNSFREFVKQHGPLGPKREEILLDFCLASVSDASDHFLKKVSKETTLQKQLNEDKIVQLKTEIQELKTSFSQEKQALQTKASQAESEKSEALVREETLREQVSDTKAEKERIEKEMKDYTKTLKQEIQKELQEAQQKNWKYEEQIKEMQRQVYQEESEKSQEIALLQQKVKFLENSLEEVNQREKKYNADFKDQKKHYETTIKDITSKYESQVLSLQNKLEAELEKYSDLEKTLNDYENQIEKERSAWQEKENQFKQLLEEANQEIKSLRSKANNKEHLIKSEWEKTKKSSEDEAHKLRTKLQNTEEKLKANEAQVHHLQAASQKEYAILQQKLEFLEQELEETKKTLEDERRHHEAMLSTFNNVNSDISSEDLEAEINKVKLEYDQKYKDLQTNYDKQKKHLQTEMTQLKETAENLELQKKMLEKDLETKNQEYQETISTLKSQKQKLTEQLKSLQAENTLLTEEGEAKMKKRVKELENSIEELNSVHSQEVSKLKQEHQKLIEQLKNYYETEKDRLEARYKEDKERNDKKYQMAVEDYEQQLRDEQEQYEEELNALQEELREVQHCRNQELQDYNHKSALDAQKIQTLEAYLDETKSQLSSLQLSHNQALENQIQNFNSERNSLLSKIEKLSGEVTFKDREYATYSYKLEQLQSKIEFQSTEMQEMKEQFDSEKHTLLERLENAKQANHKLADEISKKKSDYKREIALANQHIEFQSRKIGDLEKNLSETNKKYNESIKNYYSETGQEINELVEKLKTQKKQAEEKLEQKKKQLKETQNKSYKQITSLEKEKAVLQEKVTFLEQKKTEIEERMNAEIKNLHSQLTNRSDSPYGNNPAKEEELKDKITKLERELADCNAAYDRDKVLWENKFNFLTQQRDAARSDLNESQKKFELALERLQKRGSYDKTKVESATANLLQSVENRYSNQIKDMQSNYQSTIEELTKKNKYLEKELKQLREQTELDKKTRNTDSDQLEKRIQELLQNEENLTQEVEALKAEKETKIKEWAEFHKQEKENLCKKLSELESRVKESDQLKSQVFLEHEKERAKWALERDHLINQKNEAQDMIDRIEKRKESLLRENEKLKAERGYRSRVSSNKRDSQNTSFNKAYAPVYTQNFLAEEGTHSTPSSSATHDSSPVPLKQKNLNGAVRASSPFVLDKKYPYRVRKE